MSKNVIGNDETSRKSEEVKETKVMIRVDLFVKINNV